MNNINFCIGRRVAAMDDCNGSGSAGMNGRVQWK